MKNGLKDYTRLATGFLGTTSLWRGDQHLVYVRGKGFLLPWTEEYQRYRFEDIQSISLAKKSRVGWAIIYIGCLLVFALPMIAVLAVSGLSNMGIAQVVVLSILAVGTLVSFALLLRHWILGPACVCDIQTNLSRERIVPLGRLHATNQCLDMMVQDIRDSQSLLELEGVVVDEADRGEAKRKQGYALSALFLPTYCAAIGFGLAVLAAIHLESLALTIGLLVFVILLSLMLNTSLIVSVRKMTPPPVKSVLWMILAVLFIFSGVSAVFVLMSAIQNPVYTLDLMGPLEAFTGIAVSGGVGFYWLFIGLALGFFACGIAGVMVLNRWQRLIRAEVMPERVGDSTNG